MSLLVLYTHLDEYVPPTYDISPRLKTITTFLQSFFRERIRNEICWIKTLMCLNVSVFSEIITVWKLFSMQTSCYKGTPRKKKKTKIQCYPFFSRWMQNWEWSLMSKRFWIEFEENRLGKNPEQNLSDQNSYVRERISKILEVLFTHPDFLL